MYVRYQLTCSEKDTRCQQRIRILMFVSSAAFIHTVSRWHLHANDLLMVIKNNTPNWLIEQVISVTGVGLKLYTIVIKKDIFRDCCVQLQ